MSKLAELKLILADIKQSKTNNANPSTSGLWAHSGLALVHKDQTEATYIYAQNDGDVSENTIAGFGIIDSGVLKAFMRRVRNGANAPFQLGTTSESPLEFFVNNDLVMKLSTSNEIDFKKHVNFENGFKVHGKDVNEFGASILNSANSNDLNTIFNLPNHNKLIVSAGGDLSLTSAYCKLLFPMEESQAGGITGDNGNFKYLTLFHSNGICFETGDTAVGFNNTKVRITRAGRLIAGPWVYADDGVNNIQSSNGVRATTAFSLPNAHEGRFNLGLHASGETTVPIGNYWVCVGKLDVIHNCEINVTLTSQNHEEVLLIRSAATWFSDQGVLDVIHQSYNTKVNFVGSFCSAGGTHKYIWLNVVANEFSVTLSTSGSGMGFIDHQLTVVAEGSQPTLSPLLYLGNNLNGMSNRKYVHGALEVTSSGAFKHLVTKHGIYYDAHQKEIDVLSGPGFGPMIKGRWDAGISNRYLDFGARDNLNNFASFGKMNPDAPNGFYWTLAKTQISELGIWNGRRSNVLSGDYDANKNIDYLDISAPINLDNTVSAGIRIFVGNSTNKIKAAELKPDGVLQFNNRVLFGDSVSDDGVSGIQSDTSIRFSNAARLQSGSVYLENDTWGIIENVVGDSQSAFIMVNGDNGYEGFVDILCVAFNGQPFVISGQQVYGGGTITRTYNKGGGSIGCKCVNTSGLGLNVRTTTLLRL